MKLRATVLSLSCVALIGCADFRWYRPRAGVTGEAPDGTPAGEYTLWDGDERVGEIRIWSTGARNHGRTKAELQLGVEIECLDTEAIELVDLRIPNARISGRTGIELEELSSEGRRTAAPREYVLLDTTWLVPASHSNLERFTVAWTVRRGSGAEIAGETPFRTDVRSSFHSYLDAQFPGSNGQ